MSAFEEQGRRVLAKHGLLCQSCRVMDVVAGPPSLSEGRGDHGGSDLVLTQENKPKAYPKSKHKLIYMEACELPPILGSGRLPYYTPYRPRAQSPRRSSNRIKEWLATSAYQGRVGQRVVEALTWHRRHRVVISHNWGTDP